MSDGGTVGDLGEFGLIAEVASRFPVTPDVLLGPGDDAAIVAAPDSRVVASTDLLVEGRHFRRDWSSAREVGRKAAAQNLADVVAMGARPTALLVGLGAPADLPADWATGLADGLAEECALVGATVVGGDVVRSDTVVIAVTALGDLEGRDPVTRAGARPGDVVALAGRLGWSAAGLAVLGRGFRSPRVLADAHRVPSPPYAAGREAADAGATAMIDVSDGLVQDAGHVARASGAVLALETAALAVAGPVAEAAAAFNVDPLVWVLTGGEDHALLATFPAGTPLPDGFTAIGEVREGDPQVLVDDEPYAGAGGHDHFRP
ncbi:MAG TPA: thiamine-phosphate kinase [Candidatus Nanopelagicales bacterium]|nr:thiamine-phosphate kinase [Candidatus Nanopelagicales bacterium]